MKPVRARGGFTLVELLTVMAIIAVLATAAAAAIVPALKKARDTKRKATLSQVGRLLAGSNCFIPDAGEGDYDLGDIYPELRTKYPQASTFLTNPPKDPKGGTDAVTKYRYQLAEGGQACAVYANLENDAETVTLTAISTPTAGQGTGVLDATADGPNGSDKYFQVSNK